MEPVVATVALHGGRPGLLLAGAMVGFLVAVPVGPVAVLAVRRTLLDGRAAGWSTGLGAATGDAVFGALALFSVAALEDLLLDRRAAVQGAGGALLLGLGLVTVLGRARRRQGQAPPAGDGASLAAAFGSALIVTALNPITMVAFVSIFAAMGVTEAGLSASWTSGQGLILAGVFAGAAAWWFLLVASAAVLRRSFTERGLARLDVVCGLAIAAFGVAALATALWS